MNKLYIHRLIVFIIILIVALKYYYSAYSVQYFSYDVYYYLMFPAVCLSYYLVSIVKNHSATSVLWLWFVWPILGVTFAGSFNNLKNIWELPYDISINFYEPIFIHYVFLMFFCCGTLIYEYLDGQDLVCIFPLNKDFPNILWQAIFLLYPVFYLVSMYLSWGYLPLLSGENIVDRMYVIKLGFAQSFALVMFFSVQFTVYRTIKVRSAIERMFWILATCLICISSAIDGRRIILLLSIVGAFQLIVKVRGSFSRKTNLSLLSVAVVLYVILAFVRSASTLQMSLDGMFGTIGAEFMEFAWTVTYFDPGHIPGYNWTLSTLASLANSSALSLFDIDKQSFVIMDSARSWSRLHQSEFGIRSGIISELYFEFGYFGLIVVCFFGILFSKICSLMKETSSYQQYSFYLCIYSIILLSIMGQSTFTFGSLPTIFYIWVAWKMSSFIKIDGYLRGSIHV